MRSLVTAPDRRNDPDALLTVRDVAGWLGCSPRTVQRARIPCVRIAPRVTRYRPGDVRAWLEQRRMV